MLFEIARSSCIQTMIFPLAFFGSNADGKQFLHQFKLNFQLCFAEDEDEDEDEEEPRIKGRSVLCSNAFCECKWKSLIRFQRREIDCSALISTEKRKGEITKFDLREFEY